MTTSRADVAGTLVVAGVDTHKDVLLQQREERLHRGVVPGGGDPTHRPDQVMAT